MSPPLVSVVIPCFNAEVHVSEAIESALGQTYPHVEVIVIDDGSTDETIEVLKSFEGRIRWETGPNRGACAARNRGLELARGEYVQFLDADDRLHTEKLARQIGVAEQGKSLLFCDGDCFDSQTGQSVRSYSRRLNEGEDAVLFMLRGGLPTPAPLHWKENLLAIGGFREDLPCAQERDLHLRLACAGLTFQHLPEVLYTVRRQSTSISSDYVRVLDQHSSIAWTSYRALQESGQLTDERASAFAGFLAKDARHYLQRGYPQRAADYFAQAARMHADGGIPAAYGRLSRLALRFTGPQQLEGFVGWKRKVVGKSALWHSPVLDRQ